jgi:hypothetical protein
MMRAALSITIRTICTLAAAYTLGAPAAVFGQEPAGFPGIPTQMLDSIADIPAGPATLRGRVTHEDPSASIGEVPVVLYALSQSGVPGLRGTVTDASGAFAFESIENDPATVYLLGARYAQIPFGTRFSFEAGELERVIDLPVADTHSDTRAAEIGEVRIEASEGCENLTIRESHQLANPSRETLYIPADERASREPILRIALPENATDVQSALGADLAETNGALSYWGPLRPGEQTIEFNYEIAARGTGFELLRAFPSGASRLSLIENPGGPKLTRSGDADTAVQPGDSVSIRIELPAAADAAQNIAMLESRVWLELDGAALTVDLQHTVAVEGNAPLASESGAPLLCIPLPEGTDDLRFSSETLAMGLSRDSSGALAVRGPLPPGEAEITLRFLLPIERDDPVYSQVMSLDVPLLSVMVADTGIAIKTTRLHQRRPVRTPNRNYLHLEAFEVSAGEAVELQLQPLEGRAAVARPVATGLALATAALAIGFLIAPLRRAGTETSMPSSAASRAVDQRESVLAAIHGLDEDFEIGKVSEADYNEMRTTLRAEAVDLLRVERAALAQTADAPADAPNACPGCEAIMDANARFCSQCGCALNVSNPSDEASSA